MRADGVTPPRLRIALVIDDSLDRGDGVQQSVLALGGWLSSQGHEVHYVTSRTERTDLPNVHSVAGSVPVRFNGNKLRIPLPAPSHTLRDLLREGRFDVVHIQMPYSPLLAGRVISRLPSTTALVGTFHILPTSGLTTAGVAALGVLQHSQTRRFDALVAVSPPTAEYVRRTLHRPALVIPNPVRTRELVAAAPGAGIGAVPVEERERARVGSAENPAHVLFLGRLVPRKGAAHLLRAVSLIEDTTDLTLRVTIAGTGPQLAELTALARPLRSRVDFPGFIGEEAKSALLSDAHIVALPATGGESFGISVVEALACANGPVIAGDNPGYRSVMEPLGDQLARAEDTEAFAGAITRALARQRAWPAVVRAQRARALTFDTAVVAARVEDLYRAVLSRRRCGVPPG